MNALRAVTLILLILFSPSSHHSLVQLKALAEPPEITQGNQNKEVRNVYGAPVHLADLENQSINESSGIAASKRNATLFWTHNDSGDGPFIYSFDRRGKHRGVWRVTGAAALDWEDMAVGPGPKRGQSYIYIGDIGDNSETRDEIIVYRVAEPIINSKDSSSTKESPRVTDTAEAIRLKYPDGKHNAETLLVHPLTGDLYIVTKVSGAPAGVYKLRAPLPKSGASTLTYVGAARFENKYIGLITGGDISPDGRRVILCDYLGACELVSANTRGVAFDAIWKEPMMSISLGTRRQGEAVCYRADGSALLATSEGLPCPLIETTRRMPE